MNRCLQTDAKKFKIFYMPIISHHLSKQTIKLSFLISRRVPCIQHQPHTFQTQCMYVWMTNNAVGSELWVVNMPFNTAWGQIHGGRVSDQSHAKDSICASLSLSSGQNVSTGVGGGEAGFYSHSLLCMLKICRPAFWGLVSFRAL